MFLIEAKKDMAIIFAYLDKINIFLSFVKYVQHVFMDSLCFVVGD